MNPERFLIELIDRVGAVTGQPVLIREDEFSCWPANIVTALKAQKLLTQSKDASSAICSGCSEECVMAVHEDDSQLFILCDKRSDINRVPVNPKSLNQWRCDGQSICNFIAVSLRVSRPMKVNNSSEFSEIGIVIGKRRSQMLSLYMTDDSLSLISGSSELPLAYFIVFTGDHFSINEEMILQLVDSSSTVDKRHTPSTACREVKKKGTQALHKSWALEYRRLKKEHPNKSDVWYSKQIAKSEIGKDRKPETIRKEMTKLKKF